MTQPVMQENDSIIGFSNWLKTPAGCYVSTWEQQQLDTLVSDIFGYYAVQLGLPQLDALRASRMTMIFSACELGECQNHPTVTEPMRPQVLMQAESLPFASQSIDLVVLPHMLEFAADPHQILREIERILIPEGQIIISGFNPLSLWGARQTLGQMVDHHFLPARGQFLSLPRLKDWLKLLGFEVQRGRYGCYRPPLRSEAWLNRYAFMEKAGDRWWPICGAVYLISAVKRVQGMRLISPAWKDSKPALRGLKPVAMPTPFGHEPFSSHRNKHLDKHLAATTEKE